MIYQQAQRATRPQWWRAVLSTGQLVMAGFVAYVTWSLVILGVADRFPAVRTAARGGPHSDLFNLLTNNLILACAVPVTLFATWASYRTPGLLTSLAGRLRTTLLASCAAVAVAVQALGAWIASLFTTGSDHGRAGDVAVLLLVVLLTTPLQAAGEEFFFRGWVPQQMGVLVRSPRVALAAGTLLSSALFAWAHGQQSPWLVVDRFGFGVLACLLVWRTGGLECSIAMHAVNNIVVFVPVILAGDLHQTLKVTQASGGAVVADLAILAAYAAAVLVLIRRRPGLSSTLTPIR